MATEHLRSPELDQLIQNFDDQVAQLQASELGGAYGYLSSKFYERFRVEKDRRHLPWLDVATKYGEEAVRHTFPRDFNRAIRLDRQSSMLQDRYALLGDDADAGLVLKAAELGRQAVNVPAETDEDRLDRADFCGNLADVLLALYRQESDSDLLEEAARYAEEAALGTAGVTKANHLNTLASILFEKGLTVSSPETPGLAFRKIQQALALDSSRSGYWHTSAIIREQLYICGSSNNDKLLDAALNDALEAVKLTEQRIHTGEETRATQVTCVNHLSSLLAQRYRRYGHLEDLRKAVELGRSVFTDLKSNVPQFLRASQVLTNALAQLYEREHMIEHLNESIKISKEVLNSPSFRARRVDQAMHFNNLALRLLAHYQHTNNPKSVESALKHSMDAIRLSNGPTDQARFSVTLAGAYSARSEILGSVSDIDGAIRILSEEIENLPPDDKWRALDFLSSALSQKFRRVEAKTSDGHALLESAILHKEAVLGLLPENHSLKPDLLLRYSYLQGLLHTTPTNNHSQSLKDALTKAKEALTSLPPHHASLAIFLLQIGEIYGLQYELNRNPDHLAEAFKFTGDAQQLMDETYPYYGSALNTYGTLLIYKWTTTKPLDESFLHLSAEAFLKALRNPAGLLTERIRAGRAAGCVLAAMSRWNEAADTLKETVLLATKLAPRRLRRVDQQFYLKTVTEASAEAASICLEAGRDAAAVLSVLEAGRGIISRVSIDLQVDLARLELANSPLFFEYDDLQHKLRSLGGSSADAVTTTPEKLSLDLLQPTTASKRITIAEELEALEARIRAEVPELAQFGLTEDFSSFGDLVGSDSHAVVAFNITTQRSDAFIITHQGQVRSTPLRKLERVRAKEVAGHFVGPDMLTCGPLATFHERNEKLREDLAWLWDNAVKPVLVDLGFFHEYSVQKDPASLPRVTWITSGIIGLLPLHASGRCWAAGSCENVAFHVVSSYAPTLRALNMSHLKTQVLKRSTLGRTVVLSMPNTTGRIDLKVEKEVKSVSFSASATGAEQVDEIPRPSRLAAMAWLGKASTIFFGCHGESDTINPSNSGLLLRDGADSLPEKLTVSDIAQCLLPNGFLAYLAVCSMAENTSEALMDEVIHLSSTLLSVGFPHVVASMWEADDQAAGFVARAFFQELAEQFKQGLTGLLSAKTLDVPLALHKAVAQVREGRIGGGRRRKNASDNVTVWAPFIHLGSSTP